MTWGPPPGALLVVLGAELGVGLPAGVVRVAVGGLSRGRLAVMPLALPLPALFRCELAVLIQATVPAVSAMTMAAATSVQVHNRPPRRTGAGGATTGAGVGHTTPAGCGGGADTGSGRGTAVVDRYCGGPEIGCGVAGMSVRAAARLPAATTISGWM